MTNNTASKLPRPITWIWKYFKTRYTLGNFTKFSIFRKKEKKLKREKRRRKSSASSIDTEQLEEIKHALEGGGDTLFLLEDVDATLDLSDKDRFKSVVDLPTFVRQNEEVSCFLFIQFLFGQLFRTYTCTFSFNSLIFLNMTPYFNHLHLL